MLIARLLRALVILEFLAAVAIATGWTLHGGDPTLGALIGLAAPVVIHGAIIGLDFLLAWTASEAAPDAPRTTWVHSAGAYFRECIDSVVVFQIAQPWLHPRPLPGEDAAPDKGSPVLLIHGYGCNRQMWRPLARWLALRGHPVAAVDLEPPWADIDSHGKAILAALAALGQRTGERSVVMIGHSMGGLVARAFLRNHGTQGIAALITLGTPHHGTVHARFGHGLAARQMRPNSDWLQALNREGNRRDGQGRSQPSLHVFYSLHDNIIAPRGRQSLVGAENLAFIGLGHLTLSRDPSVFAAIGERLSALQGAEARNATPEEAAEAGHPLD